VATVTAYETGANLWEKLKAWPEAATTKRLYLEPE